MVTVRVIQVKRVLMLDDATLSMFVFISLSPRDRKAPYGTLF